ncbi:MAG: rRNA maturation RNase YbeY [Betaproteobacteria bacterium]
MPRPRTAPPAQRRVARPRLSLHVQYAATGADLPARRLLRRWASAALERDLEVTLRFVGTAEGRALNRTYRRKDAATNVLAFVYDDVSGGDIVLCAPVLRREALHQKKALEAHCAHLVVHGMLHLQGYDHHRKSDASRMEAKEIVVLAALGFDNPYLEPAHR